MPQTLFISDLHLDRERPQILALFERFLHEQAREADALYILGDLFEYWIGDDDDAPHLGGVAAALRSLTEAGVPVYFAHGNRDFLLGEDFAARTGMRLLAEETVVDLYGRPALLMHGDNLCLDDHEYMAFRDMVRDGTWQQAFLARPLASRRAEAEAMRAKSRENGRMKSPEITDVSPRAVEDALRRHGVDLLIHGHTHRPAIHVLTVDSRQCQRVVLADWYETGGMLRVTPEGMKLETVG
ncbi:UDP-2,3-diacylglucosamine diphosphatase [Thioalkalivibrio sulfidiphilus]|uniref:UDP-2,3-diacylglucosamine hydrolase n=1 Tax=Thioalkalivibrio sulfidiphilus (strain HL-EbGR7) TaxID=396588 RepID=B8GNT2_THISH|nr:UDP-2,3-diacylglucosamine diphosphatase [Thioalkalivibrio sulfidiphilus]ACL72021.1 UDP-2,3-diacylglucosamine hydrolase [Thioalkalivibrio sulfidiphilus HL-EbGr7]